MSHNFQALRAEIDKVNSFWDLQESASKKAGYVEPEPQPLLRVGNYSYGIRRLSQTKS